MKGKEVGAGISDVPSSPSKERRGCQAASQVRDWPSPCLPSPLGTFPWTKCWDRGCSPEPGGSLGSSWEQMGSLGKESCAWPGQSVEMQQPLWKLSGLPPSLVIPAPPPLMGLLRTLPAHSCAPSAHQDPPLQPTAIPALLPEHSGLCAVTTTHTQTQYRQTTQNTDTDRHTHTTHRHRQHRHTHNRYR